MKKAKTTKNLLTIFSAIIGVVFAFITGVTYCASSLNLMYVSKDVSTSAYLANQQIHLINDTVENPILFGEGAHNFEIALQYSFDYAFDVRVEYSLSWSKLSGETTDISTDNVILNFANHDNVINDEKYIYLAESVPAGIGKISLITGVEFVNPKDSSYAGRKLTITILDSNVKVYKAQGSYAGDNFLVKDLLTTDSSGNVTAAESIAAQTWLQYKINSKATTSNLKPYAMVYNYIRDYEHGVQYPGAETAYRKPTTETTTGSSTTYTMSTPVWTGGNRAYAGTSLYVVAGNTNLDIEIQVAGIWRTKDAAELNTENNIQYNYTDKWTFKNYSAETSGETTTNTGLWDVRTFNYSIPAKKGRFIDVLDSVEITSAGVNTTTAYKLVTNSIIVNATTFAYGEGSDAYKFAEIETNTSSKTTYSQDTISVINTTKYSNGLYNSSKPNAEQTFSGNISLVNNSESRQSVTVTLDLKYHISNGAETLYNPDEENKYRAIDYIERQNSGYKYLHAFNATYNSGEANNPASNLVHSLYYSYTKTDNNDLTHINDLAVPTNRNITVIIEPYSSVNLLSNYSVGSGLAEDIASEFNDASTAEKEYYDVWTYIDVQVDETNSTAAPNLIFETKQENGTTIVSVKNNTNRTVTGISIQDFALKEYSSTKSPLVTSQPYDWEASYWKYYKANGEKLTKIPETFDTTNGYNYYTETYKDYTIQKDNTETSGINEANYTFGDGFSFVGTSTTQIVDADRKLLPGESVVVITLNTTAKVMTSGTISTTSVSDEEDITIINNGKENAFIVNYSADTYYLKISGEHTGTNFVQDGGNTYYIGVVRPYQIIELSMNSTGTASVIKIQSSGNDVYADYSSSSLTGWSDNAKNMMDEFFNVVKVQN